MCLLLLLRWLWWRRERRDFMGGRERVKKKFKFYVSLLSLLASWIDQHPTKSVACLILIKSVKNVSEFNPRSHPWINFLFKLHLVFARAAHFSYLYGISCLWVEAHHLTSTFLLFSAPARCREVKKLDFSITRIIEAHILSDQHHRVETAMMMIVVVVET